MKYLFIYAHMDDETILSYGTMKKLTDEGNDVYLLTFCGLSSKPESTRSKFPESTRSKFDDRLYCYEQSISFLKKENIFLKQFYDLSLTKELIDNTLNEVFSKVNPECIVTHSAADIHFEHRLINQEVLLQSRLTENNTYIKQLWTTVSQTYSYAYNQFSVYQPNIFIDISQYIQHKKNALNQYSIAHEIPYNTDNRSILACINYNRQLGFHVNRQYCEAYQQIFSVI